MDKNQIAIKGLNDELTSELMERLNRYLNGRNEESNCSIEVVQEVESNRQLYLWYGGEVAVIKYKGYTLSLAACGDVECWLLDENSDELARVKDTYNGGSFYLEMQPYFDTDYEVMEARDRYESCKQEHGKQLAFDYCNWWDLMITDNKRNEIMDEVLDTYLFIDAVIESIEMLDDYLEQEETA